MAPIRLSEVLGQEQAIGVLRSSLASGRVHHAWIFHGPPGVGKFTTALAFAATILDPTTKPGPSGRIEPEPGSRIGAMIAAGDHPDLHVITKELARFHEDKSVRDAKQSKISNKVIKEYLLRPAALAPAMQSTEGSLATKVFIVDEAELLDQSLSYAPSQTAMLKVIEEPAPGTVIILVTSAEDRLLPTIRSRCQRVAFTPLDDAPMEEWLRRAGPPVEGHQREWLLAFAAGSPGALLGAVQGGFFEWHRSLEPMLRSLGGAGGGGGRGRTAFPVELGSTMARFIDEWAVRWVQEHENASKEAATKAGARQMFRLLAEHYRSALREAVGRLGGGTEPAWPAEPPAVRAIDLIREAERQADANVQLPYVLDNLAAQLAGGAAA